MRGVLIKGPGVAGTAMGKILGSSAVYIYSAVYIFIIFIVQCINNHFPA